MGRESHIVGVSEGVDLPGKKEPSGIGLERSLPESGIIFDLTQHQDGGLAVMRDFSATFNPQSRISGGIIF